MFSRDRLLRTIFLCQLLFFSALVAFAWKLGSHRYTGPAVVPHHRCTLVCMRRVLLKCCPGRQCRRAPARMPSQASCWRVCKLPCSLCCLRCDCSTSTAQDDPVSAARRHALRAADHQHSLRGSGFMAADQPQQSLGVSATAQQPGGQDQQQGQQQGRQQKTGTLVLYIFSPTDPGKMLPVSGQWAGAVL